MTAGELRRQLLTALAPLARALAAGARRLSEAWAARDRRQLLLCAGPTLAAAAAGEPATVDTAARTITGLVVPYGPVGATSAGRLIFAQGALSWSAPQRVKLLVEHDQRQVVGYATDLTDTPEGLRATFHLPAGPAGDTALAEAAAGLRDGLSVGVQLDDATATRMRRANGGGVQGAGVVREVSLVSVPAWDSARVDAVAASTADLVVSAWSGTHVPTSLEGSAMPCTLCGQHHAPGVACPTSTAPATAGAAPAAQAAPAPATAGAPPATGAAVQTTAAAPATTAAPATIPHQPAGPPAPAPLAVAGAAWHTASEPSTYTFDGDGHSLVVDAYRARFDADAEAAARVHRYNAELANGNPASVMALAAVATTVTDGPDSFVGPTSYRPDLLRQAIDRSRPIITRLGTVPIRNAQPFTLPVEGEFSGVDDHVEGTAHVPEGTLTGGDVTVTPKSVSGAYRLSRELIDQSNPALDRIALRAMVRDYRRHSESKVIDALTAATAVAAATGVNTVLELRAALANFVGDDDLPADELFVAKDFLANLYGDTVTEQPALTVAGGTTAGSVRAGYTGAVVDQTELVRVTRLPAGTAFAVQNDAVMVLESAVQTFRFDEVEGPGIVKLALWAYVAAAVIDPSGVERYTAA